MLHCQIFVCAMDEIENACRDLLWSVGGVERKGIHCVAREKCCAPVPQGGLGFRVLRLFTKALLLGTSLKVGGLVRHDKLLDLVRLANLQL